MNLHILNDEKFFDPFVGKLEELDLLDNNIFIVKERGPLRFIKRKDLVYGRLGDKQLIGDILQYEKVFIHAFSFELYRWVKQHTFRELNWMVWGKELYESKMVNYPLYEARTQNIVQKIKRVRPVMSSYYRKAERFFFQIDIEEVYKKVDYVLTWIKPEYDYAVRHIKGLQARHKDFAYTFEINTEAFANMFDGKSFYLHAEARKLKCLIGNSGTSVNNHIDALYKIENANFSEITMPVSYGDPEYVELLKKEVKRSFAFKNITFMDQFMTFGNYLQFFNSYDIFLSNSLRPIGMGNIWIALLMGKVVFMNNKNLVFPYLKSLGLQVYDINEVDQFDNIIKEVDLERNRSIAADFLSKYRVNELYSNLFGKIENESNIFHERSLI